MYGQSELQTSQKSFAFVIAVIAAVLVSIGCVLSTIPQDKKLSRVDLLSKINPNKASKPSLERLPGIGPARATDIVNYRKRINKSSGQPAFQKPDDLQSVKGIGPKTVENIKKWLIFKDSS